jgi:hypothetical protein
MACNTKTQLQRDAPFCRSFTSAHVRDSAWTHVQQNELARAAGGHERRMYVVDPLTGETIPADEMDEDQAKVCKYRVSSEPDLCSTVANMSLW